MMAAAAFPMQNNGSESVLAVSQDFPFPPIVFNESRGQDSIRPPGNTEAARIQFLIPQLQPTLAGCEFSSDFESTRELGQHLPSFYKILI